MKFSVYLKAQDNEMLRLLTSGCRVVFVAAVIWASIPIITFAQTTEPVTGKKPAATKPMVTDAGLTDGGNSIHNGESAQAPQPVRSILPAEIEVEIQNRFNELRRESLDNRANVIDWWLGVIAIVLTVFGIVIPIAGYFGYRRFQDIEAEAKTSAKEANKHLEEAKRIVEEIEGKRDEAEEMLQSVSAQTAVDDPKKASQAVESIQENPDASPINKTIAFAVSLQQQGKIDDAIEKWRAVAHVAEENDRDQAAVAWFSVGYLLQDEKPEDSISAYDKAIRLKPDDADAYNNRGNAKGDLGRHDEAIADYDEAIRLKPDDAVAYYNRGSAKDDLGRYDDAIANYDEAIRLKPDYAGAYNNRGVAKGNLGRYDEAIGDYDEAIRLKPDYADAYNNRGVAKDDLGRYDDAIADYDEVLRLQSDYTNAYRNRGIAYRKLGFKDEARKDFEAVLNLARNVSNADLMAQAEEMLRTLNGDEDK